MMRGPVPQGARLSWHLRGLGAACCALARGLGLGQVGPCAALSCAFRRGHAEASSRRRRSGRSSQATDRGAAGLAARSHRRQDRGERAWNSARAIDPDQRGWCLYVTLWKRPDVPRMPPDPFDRTALAGADIPSLKLAPFEASAPLKLRMALLSDGALARGRTIGFRKAGSGLRKTPLPTKIAPLRRTAFIPGVT